MIDSLLQMVSFANAPQLVHWIASAYLKEPHVVQTLDYNLLLRPRGFRSFSFCLKSTPCFQPEETLTTSMTKMDRQASRYVIRVLHDLWLFAFTAIVITVFAIAWLVEGGSIVLPPWTKDLSLLSEEDQTKYSAVLVTCICVFFALLLVTSYSVIKQGSSRIYL